MARIIIGSAKRVEDTVVLSSAYVLGSKLRTKLNDAASSVRGAANKVGEVAVHGAKNVRDFGKGFIA